MAEWKKIFVEGTISLGELSDVTVVSPIHRQILEYDTSSATWKNKTITSSVDWDNRRLIDTSSNEVLNWNNGLNIVRNLSTTIQILAIDATLGTTTSVKTTGSADLNLYLPLATSCSGRIYNIKNKQDNKSCIINAYSGDTIDNETTQTIKKDECITIQSDGGTDWLVI